MNTSTGDPEKFLTTQHERDKETGLDYRGARFYDSDIARFLSLDPLAKEFPAWSAYNYVMGNPISLIDPTGRSPEGIDDPKKKDEQKEGRKDLDPNVGTDLPEYTVEEDAPDYGGMMQERNSKNLDNAIAALTGNDKKIIANVTETTGYIGTIISTVGEVMKTRSEEMYRQGFRQGFRQGLSGNYQLTGRNLSQFGNLPAKPYTLPLSGMSKWGGRLGTAGNVFGVAVIGADTYSYTNGEMSGIRYGYHLGSYGTSIGVGMLAGGPAGFFVGSALSTAEAGYDASKKVETEMKQSYNHFYNNMMSNFLRFR
ncbi:RHS repeat-associated core domain-containing protein [Crocinitomicaceae bacterium CZZ-1]|uniref:RHS repeat-associated core domain-containing protein n=1 Tax=Taishania pollutisoli TaxID=2766479 RepID=A0A8J6PJ60_9FLAO|nr:RHS repeat-associated core domain-containing protein [Taishania pollutisoli]MBC9812636.1 RHS repeat-associated core domain-containing protein [Taishania pollutisoli]